MSRNNNLRKMAEKLPEAPNLVNGKPQYDSAGKLIMANHFRNLKEIEATLEKAGYTNKSPQMLVAWNKYTQAVIKYNERKLKREKVSYLAIYIFLMVSIVAIIIKYWR
jgi:hypothetical protein